MKKKYSRSPQNEKSICGERTVDLRRFLSGFHETGKTDSERRKKTDVSTLYHKHVFHYHTKNYKERPKIFSCTGEPTGRIGIGRNQHVVFSDHPRRYSHAAGKQPCKKPT